MTISLLIIGGGPAGLAAARAYRNAGGDGRVAMVSDEHVIPYARPPLTKDLLRDKSGGEDLAIEPESFYDEQQVELIGGRAVGLDPAHRTVTLSGGRRLEYRTCLLSTGAEPARLPVRGADHPRVSVMRTIADLQRLEARLTPDVEVAVIGSGFIACEIAASLSLRGQAVQLVSDEPAPNQRRLGAEAAEMIGGWLTAAGVGLWLGNPVDEISHARGRCLIGAGDRRVDADLVVMGAGVRPRGELAEIAGLEMDAGAVRVDAGMRTSAEGVLAAGDVAKASNVAAGRALRVEHWGDALSQGAIAGRTAAGASAAWDDVPGFWSTIGEHTLKYSAWGDGYEQSRFIAQTGGGFTVRYGAGGRLVGVLTHDDDEAYDRAATEIAEGAQWND